jgi:hypothetical protein
VNNLPNLQRGAQTLRINMPFGPAEQLMMQNSITLCVPCVDKTNTSIMLISARGVQLGHKSQIKLSPNNFPFILLLVCLLSFIQMASAMPFHTSGLSVYTLNTNGLVNPGKIAHINSAISTRRPHLFVISDEDKLKYGK